MFRFRNARTMDDYATGVHHVHCVQYRAMQSGEPGHGSIKTEGKYKVQKSQGGNGKPADFGVAEMKDKTWKKPKATTPGGARINVDQRMDLKEAKNQYSALHGINVGKGDREGSKIKRSNKEEERIDEGMKKTGCHNKGKTTQEETK